MKLIRCECGFVARGDSDDQVVGAIRGHLATDHPALLNTVSREDLVSWSLAQPNVCSSRTSRFRNTGGASHSVASFPASSPVSGRPELAMASW
jgi:predicted small metal-binding protein